MIKLVLSTEVYSLKNIEKVKLIYKEYADIHIEGQNEKVIVSFENCKYDSEMTMKEFENYLIGLENAHENN